MKAKMKKDFLVREIAGEKVLIGCGEQINFSKMLMLNDTAAYVVDELQRRGGPVETEELARSLTETYDTTFDEALTDVEDLLAGLERQGVVTMEG